MGIKRKRDAAWSDLGTDISECILRRLGFVDILRFKRACSWWFSVAESYTSSSCYRPCFQTPWLLLPPPDHQEEKADKGGERSRSFCFFNLDEKKEYRDVCLCGEVYEGRCVGSSHGWLVLLDRTANLIIFNPFCGARIQLVSLKEGGLKLLDDVDAFAGGKKYKDCRAFVSKAVLMSDHIGKKKNKDKDGVVLIYGVEGEGRYGTKMNKLAFCMFKDKDKYGRFIDLDGSYERYDDVICYDDVVCAISSYGFVEVWDFSGSSPTKVMDMRSSLPRLKAIEFAISSRQVCSWFHFYLVESCGELLSVVRVVADFVYVDADGKSVRDRDGDNNKPKIHIYQTSMFYVFRLDLHQKEWVEMDSLGDQVVFLGGNQSISLRAEDCPGCLNNSIYFTDSSWEEADENHSSGGHDMGYYNLRDRSVKPFYHSRCYKMKPTPIWVLPNPW